MSISVSAVFTITSPVNGSYYGALVDLDWNIDTSPMWCGYSLDDSDNVSLVDEVDLELVGSIILHSPKDVTVNGNYAYVTNAEEDSLNILDVSDKTNPILIGSVSNSESPYSLDGAYAVRVVGDYAYVTAIGHWYNGTFVDGKELTIIDISNKSNPILVGGYFDNESPYSMDGAWGMDVEGDYVYVGSGADDELTILNVSNKSNPVPVSSFNNSVTPPRAYGIVEVRVVGDYVYILAADSELVIIDVSNKSNPISVGSLFDDDGEYSMEGGRFVIVDDYVYVHSRTDDTFTIVDVSDKTNPVAVGSITNSEPPYSLDGGGGVVVVDNYAYVLSAEDDGVTVIDVSDKTNPFFVGWINNSDHPYSLDGGENIFVSDNYIYVTAIEDNSLTIINVSSVIMLNTTLNSTIGNHSLVISCDDEQSDYVYWQSEVGEAPGNLIHQILAPPETTLRTIADDYTNESITLNTSDTPVWFVFRQNASNNVFRAGDLPVEMQFASTTYDSVCEEDNYAILYPRYANGDTSHINYSIWIYNFTDSTYTYTGEKVNESGMIVIGSGTYVNITNQIYIIGYNSSPYMSKIAIWNCSDKKLQFTTNDGEEFATIQIYSQKLMFDYNTNSLYGGAPYNSEAIYRYDIAGNNWTFFANAYNNKNAVGGFYKCRNSFDRGVIVNAGTQLWGHDSYNYKVNISDGSIDTFDKGGWTVARRTKFAENPGYSSAYDYDTDRIWYIEGINTESSDEGYYVSYFDCRTEEFSDYRNLLSPKINKSLAIDSALYYSSVNRSLFIFGDTTSGSEVYYIPTSSLNFTSTVYVNGTINKTGGVGEQYYYTTFKDVGTYNISVKIEDDTSSELFQWLVTVQCIPSMVNTSWSEWTNISCLIDNTMNQTRNRIEYDENYCGEVSNTTYYEYQNTEYCEYVETIDGCGNLDIPNIIYVLNQNVSSEETCFNIHEDNITLDCQGYGISYNLAGSDSVFGVYSVRNNTIIKNCIIQEATSNGSSSGAIYFLGVNNGLIDNSTVESLTGGVVIYLESSSNSVISNNVIISSVPQSNIQLVSSNNNVISYNTIISYVDSGRSVFLYESSFNNVTNNNITSISNNPIMFYVYPSSSYNIFSDNIITGTFTIGGRIFYIRNGANNNIIDNNTIITSGWSGTNRVIDSSGGVFNTTVSNNIIVSSAFVGNRIIDMDSSDYWEVFNNTITISGIGSDGINLGNSNYNNFFNNLITTSGDGSKVFHFEYGDVNVNTIYNNIITTSGYPFYIATSSMYNIIYNNLINSTLSTYIDSSLSNSFNISNQTGTRIHGDGTRIGGNYWTTPSVNGYSDTCNDINDDNFCDLPYDVESDTSCSGGGCGDNVDYLPYYSGAEYVDSEPPIIYSTSEISITSQTFNITANISDNVDVSNVIIELEAPDTSKTNYTMSLLGDTIYNITFTAEQAGIWNYVIYAIDSSGNTRIGGNDITTSFQPGDEGIDVYIRYSVANPEHRDMNWDGGNTLAFGSDSSGGNKRWYTLMNWDANTCDSLDIDSIISVELQITGAWYMVSEGNFYAMNNSWNETNVTWNNCGEGVCEGWYDDSSLIGYFPPSGQTPNVYNVTLNKTWFQSMCNSPSYERYGLIIKPDPLINPLPDVNETPDVETWFYSSDNSFGRPKLLVSFLSEGYGTFTVDKLPTIHSSSAILIIGQTFNITANVTDDIGVSQVIVEIETPSAVKTNYTMSYLSGDIYNYIYQGSESGNYQYIIYAIDSSGNVKIGGAINIASFQPGSEGIDTYIRISLDTPQHADNNWDGIALAFGSDSSGGNKRWYTLMNWDANTCDSLDIDSIISVELQITGAWYMVSEGNFYAMNNSWNETNVTWNSCGAGGCDGWYDDNSLIGYFPPQNQTPAVYNIILNKIWFQNMCNLPYSERYGLIIKPNDSINPLPDINETPDVETTFYSSDRGEPYEYQRPKLSVSFLSEGYGTFTVDKSPTIHSSSAILIIGQTFNITANVTDDIGVSQVIVEIETPSAVKTNYTMSYLSGDIYNYTFTSSEYGNHTYIIYAIDSSGNVKVGGAIYITSFQPGSEGIDTYIRISLTEPQHADNNWDGTTLAFGSDSNGNKRWYTLMNWDDNTCDSLDIDSIISVELQITGAWYMVSEGNFYAMNNSWNETNVTWNSCGTGGCDGWYDNNRLIGYFPPQNQTPAVYNIILNKTWFQNMCNSPYSERYGLIIKPNDSINPLPDINETPDIETWFYSSDRGEPNEYQRPKLLVSFLSEGYGSFSVPDVLSPNVNSISITNIGGDGVTFDIQVNVTDDIQVNTVTVEIEEPSTTKTNYSMLYLSGDIFNKTYLTDEYGLHNIRIYATDTSDNMNDSVIGSFNSTCYPNIINTSWSGWTNLTCLSDDTMNQSSYLTEYDTNYCGEVSNVTYYDYQNTEFCDFCTPDITNTSWSDWINISCLSDDTMNQSRYLIGYDNNYCGEISNVTYYGYQNTEYCLFVPPLIIHHTINSDNTTEFYSVIILNQYWMNVTLQDTMLLSYDATIKKKSDQTLMWSYENNSINQQTHYVYDLVDIYGWENTTYIYDNTLCNLVDCFNEVYEFRLKQAFPPVITVYQPTPPPDVDGAIGQTIYFDIEVSDSNSEDLISYNWELDYVGVATTEDYSYPLLIGSIGTVYTVTVTATDDSPFLYTDEESWNITVTSGHYSIFSLSDLSPIVIDGLGTAGASVVGWTDLIILLLVLGLIAGTFVKFGKTIKT